MIGRVVRALALPLVVPGIVPWLLAAREGAPGRWPPAPAEALASLVLAAAGLALLGATVHLFATEGQGTLVPWDPPRRLVVRGIYRHVRNPMITGVFLVILGEAVVLASPAVGSWFVAVMLINLVYIPLSEEPGLDRRFGDAYRVYKRNVPRWIPRLSPWSGGDAPLP